MWNFATELPFHVLDDIGHRATVDAGLLPADESLVGFATHTDHRVIGSLLGCGLHFGFTSLELRFSSLQSSVIRVLNAALLGKERRLLLFEAAPTA
jgi:hypothetical protein